MTFQPQGIPTLRTMRRRSDGMTAKLQQRFSPFNRLSVTALLQANEALRPLRLHSGEEITLRGPQPHPDHLFLVEGRVELRLADGDQIVSADEQRHPIVLPGNGGRLTLVALQDSLLVHVNTSLLDEVIAWDQMVQESGRFTTETAGVGINGIRNAKVLRNLPMESVDEALRRMTTRQVKAGTDVIRQGDKGDAFYLILTGQAEVWRQGLQDSEQKRVAILDSGEGFGEEALVVDGYRNATVRMTTDATLLVLAKKDFQELVAVPMIQSVRPEQARAFAHKGYHFLDVRYPEEHEEGIIPGSLLIPLPDIRDHIPHMPPEPGYILVCHSGKRAAVAALLMRQRHIPSAMVLEGGVRDWPYDLEVP